MSSSKPAQKSSAVMIMPANFSHELILRGEHVKQFTKISSKNIWLKIMGRMWEVQLKRVEGGGLSFGKGWREFVEDNSIEANDLLYFKVNGSTRVNVTVYCRKERGVRKSVKNFRDKRRIKHEPAAKKLCNLENENAELHSTGRMYMVVDEDDDLDVVFCGPSVDSRKELDNVCDNKSSREEENDYCGEASNKADKDLLEPVVENMGVDVDKQLIIHEDDEVNLKKKAEVKSNSANRKCRSTELEGLDRSSKNGTPMAKVTGGRYLPLGLPRSETFAAEPNGHVQLPKIDGSRDEDIFPLSYIMLKSAGSNGHNHPSKAEVFRVEDTYDQDVPVISRKRKAYSGKRSCKKSPVKKNAAVMDKPKRFLGAYMVFMEEFRKLYKKEHPTNKNVTVVGRAAGEKWRKMSEAEKAPYAAEALARKNLYYQTKQAEERIVEDKEEAEPKSEVNNENDEELGYMEGDSDKDEEVMDDEEKGNKEDDEDDDEVRQEEDGGMDDKEKSNAEDDKEEDEEVEGEVDQVEDTDFSDDD